MMDDASIGTGTDGAPEDEAASVPPPDLLPLLGGAYYLPFGLARRGKDGWECLKIRVDAEEAIVEWGPLFLDGFTGVLGEPWKEWRLEPDLLERIVPKLPVFPLDLSSWRIGEDLFVPTSFGSLRRVKSEPILELRIEHLSGQAWQAMVADADRRYYWHGDWDPAFYAAQARAGCIAISADRGDRRFLLPELQTAYAVLDWENLHVGRSLRRLFRSGALEAMGVELRFNPDPGPAMDGLEAVWGERSWLVKEYRAMIEALAIEPRSGLRPWGVELWARSADGSGPHLAAGELGYTIGGTYTSLSGFLRRERREWRGLGSVQLRLLAERLRDSGFAFWNLGHPHMQYKLDLGARILPRKEFLGRWEEAVAMEKPILR